MNIFRYLGLSGDQWVQVFILISGFVLTLGLSASRRKKVDFKSYFRRRIVRIYPVWVLCHVILMVTWIFFKEGIKPFSSTSWLSMAGIRFMPHVVYYGTPAWWFIVCLLQLYILLPFIFKYITGRKNIYFEIPEWYEMELMTDSGPCIY